MKMKGSSTVADIINPLLAGMFLFMKFSLGLSAILMIAALAIVRILRRQKNAWRSALLVSGIWLGTVTVIAIPYCQSLRTFVSWVVSRGIWLTVQHGNELLGKPLVVVWALMAIGAYLVY